MDAKTADVNLSGAGREGAKGYHSGGRPHEGFLRVRPWISVHAHPAPQPSAARTHKARRGRTIRRNRLRREGAGQIPSSGRGGAPAREPKGAAFLYRLIELEKNRPNHASCKIRLLAEL